MNNSVRSVIIQKIRLVICTRSLLTNFAKRQSVSWWEKFICFCWSTSHIFRHLIRVGKVSYVWRIKIGIIFDNFSLNINSLIISYRSSCFLVWPEILSIKTLTSKLDTISSELLYIQGFCYKLEWNYKNFIFPSTD